MKFTGTEVNIFSTRQLLFKSEWSYQKFVDFTYGLRKKI